MKLVVKIEAQGENTTVHLGGILDERCELPVFEAPIKGKLYIDLEKLFMINSLGCRKWVNWIRDIKAEKGIHLTNCSPPVVNQINILAGFIPENVTVDSIFVPYFCEACSVDIQKLFPVSKNDNRPAVEAVPETVTCTQCNQPMDLDVLKSRYFAFILKKAA